MSRARVAMKFLVYGLVIGILFAPRSGEETRELLIRRVREIVEEMTGREKSSDDQQV